MNNTYTPIFKPAFLMVTEDGRTVYATSRGKHLVGAEYASDKFLDRQRGPYTERDMAFFTRIAEKQLGTKVRWVEDGRIEVAGGVNGI